MKITSAQATTPPSEPATCGLDPDTNVDEGHLGGYVRGRQSVTPTESGYEHGDPLTWYPELWRWAVRALGVRSVLDVGCGEGHGARFFQDLGCRVTAVDGSLQARRDSVVPERHVVHDFARGVYLPADGFDLVWSCEFVEHVEERHLPNFLVTFACGDRYLMMTFAGPGQPGHHHVNCRPADYWIERLASIGFRHDEARTLETRTLATGHYGERGLFFVRG